MIPFAEGNQIKTDRSPDSGYVKTQLLTEMLVDHLPRLPWFLRDLQSALEDGSTDLHSVCAALKAHPTVLENFVRIGAMAEPVQPIRTPLDHLVVSLGKQRTWSVALAAYALCEMTSAWSTAVKQEAGSISLALANNALARARMAGDENPEQAFVAGVLSVIGFLPLIEASGETNKLPEWLDASKEAIHLQREIFGTDFLELNCWIRLLWRLPLLAPEETLAVQPAGSEPASSGKDEALVPVLPLVANDAAARNLVLVSRGVV
jgi:HD-like signal output (HDOD) protein